MGRIPIPPPGGFAKSPKRCCLPYGEALYIDFKHNGFFWPTENGVFDPDLPTGDFSRGIEIGPFMPAQNNVDITLNLFSFDDKRIHRRKIQIRTRCLPRTKCS